MLFVALCQDKPDHVALRLATREAHLAFLAEHATQVKLGGAFLDAAGEKPLGSMLIVEARDAAAARALLARDPYALAGLFVSVEVKPWRRAVGAEL
ncbi:YciI family protein [Methylosinus sp. Sm6]|uniref:YciI family protein n=1 Tax=Methylosinus sp. Sm6 TaxID=2866948 RepID=UPI001C9918C2|nr:YciI family protein [Methylosinus sp. Sm6]MBY6242577.1 YciI family protein [Methylosinus sp. Sm6]